jgi:hypothetical protein
MKKLILSLALTAFAAVAAQADDAGAKAPAAEQHSCCKAKAAQQQASTSCCSKAKQTTVKKTQVKQALLSPKATAAL